MAYSIESTTAQRCTSNLNGQRCGLAELHADEHVAPDGRQRWAQSIFAPLAEAWGGRIGSPTAGQKVTADNVGKAAAILLSQRMDRISAVLDDRIDDANRRSEGARVRALEASEAAERAGEALAREVKAREALSAELVTTRRGRLSPLEDRVAKLELPYGHVQAVKDTHNALVERIERLEGDLRDTHDLAERVATARCSPGRCGPMDELDDQTYSLDRALTDVLKAKTTPEQARAAAEWIRRHIASMETKVGHLEHLLTARMRNESQPASDSFRRCDVSVPKQCVLQLGHGGHSHVSNSGTMWPTDDRRTLLPVPTSELDDAPKFDGLA